MIRTQVLNATKQHMPLPCSLQAASVSAESKSGKGFRAFISLAFASLAFASQWIVDAMHSRLNHRCNGGSFFSWQSDSQSRPDYCNRLELIFYTQSGKRGRLAVMST